jgi:hypothetical protein
VRGGFVFNPNSKRESNLSFFWDGVPKKLKFGLESELNNFGGLLYTFVLLHSSSNVNTLKMRKWPSNAWR